MPGHHHHPPSPPPPPAQTPFEKRVLTSIEVIERALTIIINTQEKHMAISQAILDVLARIDTATNNIAAKLKALADQIGTGMSQADVDSLKASMTGEADKLEAMAADPANPVPGSNPVPG